MILAAMILAPVILAPIILAMIVVAPGRGCLRRGRRGGRRNAALDDLVEFAPVKPDTTALGAVIDLDSLSVGHDKLGSVDRAKHRKILSFGSKRRWRSTLPESRWRDTFAPYPASISPFCYPGP
jgi:hypothetical protein